MNITRFIKELVGGLCITQNNRKFWIHKVDYNDIKKIDKSHVIGSKSKRFVKINEINPNDSILLFTKRNSYLEFFGYTQVDSIGENEGYTHCKSNKILNLKGVKYFSKPLVIKDISEKLSFMKDNKPTSKQYKEIDKEDFTFIMNQQDLTLEFPPYLDDFTMSLDQFIKLTKDSVLKLTEQFNLNNAIDKKYFKDFLSNFKVKENLNHDVLSSRVIDDDFNFWIHRVPHEIILDVQDNKKIGGSNSVNQKILDEIGVKDNILIFTNFNGSLEFIGCCQVEEFVFDPNVYYNYYISNRKIKLDNLEFFIKPLKVKDFTDELSFIEDPEKSADKFKAEYRQITPNDFKLMYENCERINEIPLYMKKVSMNLEEFIIINIHNIYNFINENNILNQIEIKKFVKVLQNVLSEYGVHKTFSELLNFYSEHALEYEFLHVPTRDVERSVNLKTKTGKTVNYGFITFK